jgi:wobble nucleotide-excising tRNase
VLPKNVSIGERNIIALCYFFTQIMANQDVSKAYEKEVLVVVDDPVSSFDFENRVGILSYMNYQMDRLVRGNPHNKMLIFTHDLTTMHDLMASASDIVKILKAQDQKQDWKTSFRELRDRKLEDAFHAKKSKNLNEYSKMLMGIYNYAIGEAPEDYAMGNVMRRVLEAFATFNYRTGIAYVTRNQEVLQELDKAKKVSDVLSFLPY